MSDETDAAHAAMSIARELLLCEVMDNTYLCKCVLSMVRLANCNSVSSEILQN